MWKKDDSAGSESSFLLLIAMLLLLLWGPWGRFLWFSLAKLKTMRTVPMVLISHLASFPMIMLYFRKFV
ncbi:hypothetical protein CHI06_00385 [Bacillus sp. 7884-1]|nr:hypothetical protein CHI06_00385 [Bacillus sp. 7884-1]